MAAPHATTYPSSAFLTRLALNFYSYQAISAAKPAWMVRK